jgi:hypothetical protein
MSVYPTNPTPNYSATDDPCATLAQLRADYRMLITGRATQQVRDGERWRNTHNGSAVMLQKEIRRLEILCGQGSDARAIRVGPYSRS